VNGGIVNGVTPDSVLGTAAAVARELADPVRLHVLQLLASEGPCTASRLADEIGVTAPRLGNHLARLREAGLVTVEHTGRHAIYRLTDGGLGDVLTPLLRYAGYVAGLLGVRLFGHLVERGAVQRPDGRTGELALGPDPAALLELGVDPLDGAAPRRKIATACLDRTYRLPHLGGRLGGTILAALVRQGWVEQVPDSRVLLLTPSGAARFAVLLRAEPQ
jgi:DNA-binding transcriptional ArsR family regulator